MKRIILILAFSVLTVLNINAQEKFDVSIEPVAITGVPGVHSFSWGKTSDGKWVILGGRIDGLHERMPFSSFAEAGNNKKVFIIDVDADKTWETSLSVLTSSIFEQLQSTNQQFYQRGNTLYIFGGYGYSPSAQDHITYPYLTAIELDGLADAVINDADISGFFRQIEDTNLAVTGGQIGYLDEIFYLCGGQYFKGRYNPRGPGQGTGFTQRYTDAIRKFKINDSGGNLAVYDYTAIIDAENLHRRDYNMAPQIFPDGKHGFTIFTGVFQILQNLPFLNTVNVTDGGYTVNNDFTQYLSHYHSAKIPVYDAVNKTMHTIFFGGMSQYQIDTGGNLIKDDNVPFVKTISKVTRFSDGSMKEAKLEIEMPALVGSGAEFIPLPDIDYIDNDILDLNKLPEGKVLVGYIYGGIESTQPNIFFINDGTQSSASSKIFKVYIHKSVTSVIETELSADNIFNMNLYPNPVQGIITVEFFMPNTNTHSLSIYNTIGEEVRKININKTIGRHSINIDMTGLPTGAYILMLSGNGYTSEKKIIKK